MVGVQAHSLLAAQVVGDLVAQVVASAESEEVTLVEESVEAVGSAIWGGLSDGLKVLTSPFEAPAAAPAAEEGEGEGEEEEGEEEEEEEEGGEAVAPVGGDA